MRKTSFARRGPERRGTSPARGIDLQGGRHPMKPTPGIRRRHRRTALPPRTPDRRCDCPYEAAVWDPTSSSNMTAHPPDARGRSHLALRRRARRPPRHPSRRRAGDRERRRDELVAGMRSGAVRNRSGDPLQAERDPQLRGRRSTSHPAEPRRDAPRRRQAPSCSARRRPARRATRRRPRRSATRDAAAGDLPAGPPRRPRRRQPLRRARPPRKPRRRERDALPGGRRPSSSPRCPSHSTGRLGDRALRRAATRRADGASLVRRRPRPRE